MLLLMNMSDKFHWNPSTKYIHRITWNRC